MKVSQKKSKYSTLHRPQSLHPEIVSLMRISHSSVIRSVFDICSDVVPRSSKIDSIYFLIHPFPLKFSIPPRDLNLVILKLKCRIFDSIPFIRSCIFSLKLKLLLSKMFRAFSVNSSF